MGKSTLPKGWLACCWTCRLVSPRAGPRRNSHQAGSQEREDGTTSAIHGVTGLDRTATILQQQEVRTSIFLGCVGSTVKPWARKFSSTKDLELLPRNRINITQVLTERSFQDRRRPCRLSHSEIPAEPLSGLHPQSRILDFHYGRTSSIRREGRLHRTPSAPTPGPEDAARFRSHNTGTCEASTEGRVCTTR